jgi:hypothetical protein
MILFSCSAFTTERNIDAQCPQQEGLRAPQAAGKRAGMAGTIPRNPIAATGAGK